MSELATLLSDTVGRIFSDHVTQELLEAAEQGEWPEELWRTVEESGLTRPHLPESAGGSGGGWGDAYLVLHAAGRHQAPIPIAETMLASWLLHRAGIEIPEGPITILPSPVAESAVSAGRVSARAAGVPWGRNAPHVVMVVDGERETRVALATLPASCVAAKSENIAREPRDEVRFESLPLIEMKAARLPREAVRLYMAMLRSAQIAGAVEATLEMSVRYANERVQFGKPIRKFQAIQQELARLAGECAAASIAAQAAFRAADRAEHSNFDPKFEIAVAKVRTGEAASFAPSIAHQVHGAIGFTYEHRLHIATRRLWSWRMEFGPEQYWSAWLGRHAINLTAAELWPFITSRGA
jgi:acyl-CoA dehydrogenase